MVYDPDRQCWILIDFQMSRFFQKPWKEPPLVLMTAAGREPESSPTIPYDPLPAEAYTVGALLSEVYGWSPLTVRRL